MLVMYACGQRASIACSDKLLIRSACCTMHDLQETENDKKLRELVEKVRGKRTGDLSEEDIKQVFGESSIILHLTTFGRQHVRAVVQAGLDQCTPSCSCIHLCFNLLLCRCIKW